MMYLSNDRYIGAALARYGGTRIAVTEPTHG